MFNFHRIFKIVISYLAVFLVTVIISGLIQNTGTVSGKLQDDSATLPLLYVRSGGSLINEMHGHIEEVDAGYYRDTMTPVDDSRTVNLVLDEYEYSISSVSFALYNDQNTELVEEGDATELVQTDSSKECQINFKQTLVSNCEYCLHIILNYSDSEDKQIYYYTRVRYGSQLQIAEKLKFMLDFNEQTFSKDNEDNLSNYLESTGSSSGNYSYTDIYSSVDDVTWGDLQPSRTSDITICLKEINTETAAFTLNYDIESSVNDETTFYNVEEYYRIRISEDKTYLLDFQRIMTEDWNIDSAVVSDGCIRLGPGDGSNLSFSNYGTSTQQYSYVSENDKLWVYDSTNDILTSVYEDNDTNHNCACPPQQSVKVMSADDATGDLYFVVYGYMHDGSYEGREGLLVYHFSYQEDKLEQLLFIPYYRGFEQLDEGISRLAYMNDDGDIYFMIENTIYEFSISTGRLETAWENVKPENCAVSDSGIVAMVEDAVSGTGAGTSLKIINLNNDKSKKIEGNDMLVTPLGYIGSDLIYGSVDSSKIAEDSTGTVQVPVSEVFIVDKNLNEIKTYQKSNKYIMSTEISGNMISFTLGKASKVDGYTDYTDDSNDYIIHNVETEDSAISISTSTDSVRGIQYYLKLSNTYSLIPVTQSARHLDPGYDITKEYTPSQELDVRYYVYTRGCLADSFSTLKEAINYGNTYAGTIMTSHKQIVWQRAGSAYLWDLDITEIEEAKKGSQNTVVVDAIASYEGWDKPSDVDKGQQLFAVMTEKLPAETINLSGIDLADVLHFVYRDRIVVAKTGTDTYCLITGYTSEYVTVADIASGTVSQLTLSAAQEEFDKAGDVYYSYFD